MRIGLATRIGHRVRAQLRPEASPMVLDMTQMQSTGRWPADSVRSRSGRIAAGMSMQGD
jgi:hypothetical protein